MKKTSKIKCNRHSCKTGIYVKGMQAVLVKTYRKLKIKKSLEILTQTG